MYYLYFFFKFDYIMSIINYDIIDYEKITLTTFKSITKTLKTSKVLYDNSDFMVKGSKVLLKKIISNSHNKFTKLTLEFLPESDDFYQFFFDYRNVIIDKLYSNSKLLFGINIPERNIENLMRHCVNLPNSLKECPKFDLEIDDLLVVNSNNDKIDVNSLQEDTLVEILFTIDEICFYTNKITINLKAKSIKNYNQIPQLQDYMLSNDSSNNYSEISG